MKTTDVLLDVLDEACSRKSWHGASLRGALPGVTADTSFLVRGIAAHDVYHAGPIQLLKRLQRTR